MFRAWEDAVDSMAAAACPSGSAGNRANSICSVKEKFQMPFGDRTGPLGQGPKTGRGAGLCSGSAVPGSMNRGSGFWPWRRRAAPEKLLSGRRSDGLATGGGRFRCASAAGGRRADQGRPSAGTGGPSEEFGRTFRTGAGEHRQTHRRTRRQDQTRVAAINGIGPTLNVIRRAPA